MTLPPWRLLRFFTNRSLSFFPSKFCDTLHILLTLYTY
jgi:hypothetical protein